MVNTRNIIRAFAIVAIAIAIGFLVTPEDQMNADREAVAMIESIPAESFPEAPNAEVKTIVTVKDGVDAEQVVPGAVKKDFTIIDNTVSANLTPNEVEELRDDPNVELVEPDSEVSINSVDPTWGFNRIEAGVVQASGVKGDKVKIAVIDTGVDYTHPALSKVYAGGYDLLNGDNDPMDDNVHGSHCAGIIAAQFSSATKMQGVAPNVQLYALKVLSASGNGNYSNMIAALQWCINNKIDIASMSFSGSRYSVAFKRACENAVAAGVTLVAAAGNNGSGVNTVGYPARYESVIAVSAIDPDGDIAGYSSTGPDVDISAPGTDILSTCLNNKYYTMSGTSMACPHVAGVAGLLFSTGITSPASIREKLYAGATDMGPSGLDNSYGYGLVNARKTVLTSLAEKDIIAHELKFDGMIEQGKAVAYSISYENLFSEDIDATVRIRDLTYGVDLFWWKVTLPRACVGEMKFQRKFSAKGQHVIKFSLTGDRNTENNSKTVTIEVL